MFSREQWNNHLSQSVPKVSQNILKMKLVINITTVLMNSHQTINGVTKTVTLCKTVEDYNTSNVLRHFFFPHTFFFLNQRTLKLKEENLLKTR